MSGLSDCPKCDSKYAYEDSGIIVCPECFHEWSKEIKEDIDSQAIRDSNGNILMEGDSIIVVKDLKVKGASAPIKKGTKVKNIKLIHSPSDGHDIDCRVDGFGAMKLKSEFVKKA